MRAQATALAASLERDDYQAAEHTWQALAQLKIIGSAEVEQMIQELAGMPLKNFMLRHVTAYKEEALKYNFGEAERQLALLRAVLCHFPNTDLQVSLSALELLLAQCKETQQEKQRNMTSKLAASKQEAVQEVREEMEQKIQQLMSPLEAVMRQMGMNENEQQRIREMAQEIRNDILEGLGGNQMIYNA
jgi:hypothetical protein